jgi:hypothetical protein
MQQLAIRILNAGLIGLCSFQGAEVVNLIATESLKPTTRYEAPAAPPEERARSEWQARQTILDRNLFGAKIVDETSEPEPIVEEKLEETKLPLVLEATIALSDAGASRAAILDTRTRDSMILGVGDSLTSYTKVTVAVIERGRVLLKNSGRHEVLLLNETDGGSEFGSNAESASTSRASRSRTTRSRSARARRPSTRSRAAEARAEKLRELAEAADENGEDGELTLEGITAEIERLREIEDGRDR